MALLGLSLFLSCGPRVGPLTRLYHLFPPSVREPAWVDTGSFGFFSVDSSLLLGCSSPSTWAIVTFLACLYLGPFCSLFPSIYLRLKAEELIEGGERSLALGDSGCFSFVLTDRSSLVTLD